MLRIQKRLDVIIAVTSEDLENRKEGFSDSLAQKKEDFTASITTRVEDLKLSFYILHILQNRQVMNYLE